MKKNLGNMLKIFIIFSFVFLFAEDFTYEFRLSKEKPYVKEPITLTLDLNQTNHDVVLLFNFDLKKSNDYFFQRLDTKESDTHHNTQIHYVYLIYPLKAGDINIDFELVKKVTTDDSVAYSFSGDRDNVKGLVTTDTEVSLPTLTLKTKELPQKIDLVGDFKLTYKFKTKETKAYEPIPFEVKIEGYGYPPLLDNLVKKDKSFTLFKEKPIVKSLHSKDGTESSVTYSMALSASKSFDLNSIEIKAFDPKKEKSYILSVPKQHFNVSKVDVNTLVDKVDTPKALVANWSWLSNLLSYALVFVAGYLTAISLKWKKIVLKSHLVKEDEELMLMREKIKKCKDKKSLLQLLMASKSKKFAKSIEKLESSLYGKDKTNLEKIKKSLLENL
jgi:hypothetical protein